MYTLPVHIICLQYPIKISSFKNCSNIILFMLIFLITEYNGLANSFIWLHEHTFYFSWKFGSVSLEKQLHCTCNNKKKVAQHIYKHLNSIYKNEPVVVYYNWIEYTVNVLQYYIVRNNDLYTCIHIKINSSD